MRVLWIHNFNPSNKFDGIFMKQLVEPLKQYDIHVDLHYAGKLRRNALFMKRRIENLNEVAADYDIIHAQYGSMNGFVVSRMKGRKVLSLRGSDWHRIKQKFPLFDYLHGCASVFLSKIALRGYSHIIAMSHRMTNEVSKHARHAELYTLPDAIDLTKFKMIDYAKAREKIGIKPHHKLVIFAAVINDNPIKRPYLARDAVNMAQSSNQNIIFKPLNDIPHSDMPTYYSAADAIITTSVHEGWPNCIKEALACNLPFIATDTSDLWGIAEMEDTCHVCPPVVEELSEALLDTLSKNRPKDLQKYVTKMNMENFVKDLARIYKDMLKHKTKD
jgi:glycosyltransferase involved in cell wall biosynthesis